MTHKKQINTRMGSISLMFLFGIIAWTTDVQAYSHYGVAWGTNTTVTWSIATGTTIDLSTPELDGSFLDDGTPATRTTSNVTAVTGLTAQASTAITSAFNAWQTALTTAGANVTFQEVTESGTLAFNSPSESAGSNVGQIRIWAYDFAGNAAGQKGFAFIPNADEIGGDIFIDANEVWTDNSFYSVFLHELGHAIGLAHSSVGGAVMTTPPPGLTLGDAVTADDVAGVTDLYGGSYSDMDAGGSVVGAYAGAGSPEPSTIFLGMMGVLCMALMIRRSLHENAA